MAAEILEEEWDENEEYRNRHSPDRIWQELLQDTVVRARPDNFQDVSSSSGEMQNAILKVRVLSNMLDCVVNHPDLTERRKYIGRVLKLSKSIQRRLMNMIEKRVLDSRKNDHSQPSKQQMRTPSSSSRKSLGSSSTPRPILRSDAKYSTPTEEKTTYSTPSRSMGSPQPTRPEPVASQKSTPSRLPATPNAQAVKFAPMTTPGSVYGGGDMEFMSPTQVMDSPAMAQRYMQQMQRHNADLQAQLDNFKEKEKSRKGEEERFRQQMMKIESSYLNRQHEMEDEYHSQIRQLKSRLEEVDRERVENSHASLDMKKMQDELEVGRHAQVALKEAKERIRGYRLRVEEFQDVKEALQREEEAHGKAVEDVVRLQNEVQALQPLKRQLEDYKTRAIEAEVKLVECQESLRRLELEFEDSNEEKSSMFQESRMQKQQLEEMVQRIKEETQRSIESSSGGGLGEGMSELNPKVKAELIRLRNENLQLRAFAAKRQDDAVEQLESKLDDSRRFADKYKSEFVQTKDRLVTTENELNQIRKESTRQINDLRSQLRAFETKISFLTTELEDSSTDLIQVREMLEQSNGKVELLTTEKKQLSENLKDKVALIDQGRQQLEFLSDDLHATKEKLEKTEKLYSETRETANSWEQNAKQMESEFIKSQEELQEVEEQLSLAQKTLRETQAELKEAMDQLEKEQQSNQDLEAILKDERESNQKALAATKEILSNKLQQELNDQSQQLNSILDEERRAKDRAEEEMKRAIDEVKSEKQVEIQAIQEHVTKLQDEAQKRENELKNKAEQAARQASEKLNETIRKGKDMIEKLKEDTHEEMTRLDEERKYFETELEEEKRLRAEYEEKMRQTFAALKQRLTQTTNDNNDLLMEKEEFEDRIKLLEEEQNKLKDDNDRYRRQIGNGGGGRMNQQYESLKSEFNDVVEENRKLRLQQRENASIDQHSNVRNASITMLRKEYEEKISELNDDRRGLVMKYSAATTEIEKAEKRVFEREQEIVKLKAEITSLSLAIKRAEMAQEMSGTTTSSRVDSIPHYSASPQTPPRPLLRSRQGTQQNQRSPIPATPPSHSGKHYRSPSIDKAKKEKEAHETMLRNKISSLRRSTPTRNTDDHDQERQVSILDFVQADQAAALAGEGDDARPECQQS